MNAEWRNNCRIGSFTLTKRGEHPRESYQRPFMTERGIVFDTYRLSEYYYSDGENSLYTYHRVKTWEDSDDERRKKLE